MLYQLSYIGPPKAVNSGQWLVASNSVLALFPLAANHWPLATVFLERETGIEPATNSLEGCDSTIELLPPLTSVNSGQWLVASNSVLVLFPLATNHWPLATVFLVDRGGFEPP